MAILPDKSLILPVVAGALIHSDGRILLQRRPRSAHHGGLWEFPGGKIEAAETARDALLRELDEELGVRIAVETMVEIGFADVPLGARNLLLLLYRCTNWTGTPTPRQPGARLAWYAAEELAGLEMPPADQRLRTLFGRLLPGT